MKAAGEKENLAVECWRNWKADCSWRRAAQRWSGSTSAVRCNEEDSINQVKSLQKTSPPPPTTHHHHQQPTANNSAPGA